MKLAWSRLFQQLIFILFNALVLTVPFVFFWANEELFEFNKMLLTYAVTLLILAAWLARMVSEKRLILRRTIFDIPIVIFVISQVLATIFSIHPYTSFFGYYTRFHGGLLSTLTYTVLFYAFVSNVPRRQLPVFFVTLLAAAIGVSMYAIPEHFGYSPSCLLINDNHAFDVSCWIQKVQDRVFGTFGQPNWLAAYAITLIPWSIGLVGWSYTSSSSTATSYRRVIRWLAAAASVLLFATLLYTKSRSGLLGFALGKILLVGGGVWLLYRLHEEKNRAVLRTLSLWLVGIGLVWLVLFISSGDVLVSDITSTLGFRSTPTPTTTTQLEAAPVVNRLDTGITDSGDIRKIVWQGAVNIWKRYPLFGSGVETFAYSYYQDRPVSHNLVSEWDFLYNKAHNEFLNFLATTGAVGAIAYVLLITWIVVVGVRGLYRAGRKNDLGTAWIMLGLTCGVTALTISNLLGFSTVMVTILLFLTPALMVILKSQDDDSSALTTPVFTPSTSQWLLLGGIGFVSLYGLFMIWTLWRADYHYAQGKNYFNAGYYPEGVTLVQQAVLESPNEALFYDELAVQYSQLAGGLAQQGDATNAAQLAEAAVTTSDRVMELNDRHLNFYKSRGRIFINLSVLDPAYMVQAKEALEAALKLAPTDAKLMYNLALVEIAMDQPKAAQTRLEETIAIKSNYGAARIELAKLYRADGNYPAAIAQYQYILDTITPNDPETVQALQETEQEQATQSAGLRN